MTIGQTIWRNILGESARQSIGNKELMNAMRMSNGTFYSRQKDPDSLTVEEIQRAAKLLNVRLTDLIK